MITEAIRLITTDWTVWFVFGTIIVCASLEIIMYSIRTKRRQKALRRMAIEAVRQYEDGETEEGGFALENDEK